MDNPHPVPIGALVTGLLSDIRCLLRQEIELARHEMQDERRKLGSIVIRSGAGVFLGMVSAFFLLMMSVHLLRTLTDLPLWACYGVVGFIAALGTGVLLYSVATLGATLRFWPFRTFHSLKEDVQWIKEQVLSTRT